MMMMMTVTLKCARRRHNPQINSSLLVAVVDFDGQAWLVVRRRSSASLICFSNVEHTPHLCFVVASGLMRPKMLKLFRRVTLNCLLPKHTVGTQA